MGGYLQLTDEDRRGMLGALSADSVDALFAPVPDALKRFETALPSGRSEMAVLREMERMADKNRVFPHIFRGAGAYRHYIPAIVKEVAALPGFRTAYTPYQAEVSQGVLQSIFEYQTLICELTGMDASNASVYDGASATAEAVRMCLDGKRHRVLLSNALHPMVRETVRTYLMGLNAEIVDVPEAEGRTDLAALDEAMLEGAACLVFAQPNYYGLLEDADELSARAHARGLKVIANVNPISLGLLKPPGEYQADIAVGEGQPLGLEMAFGGPYLGFMATTKAMLRKLPGRIVGETVDRRGERAYVLTLQAREQHIRREKAGSNICSNEAHCAIRAAAYLAAMGPDGLREVAQLCHDKAVYMADGLTSLPGVRRVHPGEFFHEVVLSTPVAPEALNSALEQRGILGGLPVEGGMLWCATEMNTREEIDALIQAVAEVIS